MITPKIGLAGQLFLQGGPGPYHGSAAQVTAVHSEALVDAQNIGGNLKTSIAFVDVGGVAPAAPANYFQAIDAAS